MMCTLRVGRHLHLDSHPRLITPRTSDGGENLVKGAFAGAARFANPFPAQVFFARSYTNVRW